MCGRVTTSKASFDKAYLEITGKPPFKSNPEGFHGPGGKFHVIGKDNRNCELIWGFPVYEDPTKIIYNARIETITAGQYWHFCKNRYVFPVERFYEMSSGKFYASQDGIMLGAIGTEKNFTVVTRPANHAESLIHHRMPVILLNASEAIDWINGVEHMETLHEAVFHSAEKSVFA